jgi:hypothetical protein
LGDLLETFHRNVSTNWDNPTFINWFKLVPRLCLGNEIKRLCLAWFSSRQSLGTSKILFIVNALGRSPLTPLKKGGIRKKGDLTFCFR